MDLDMSDAFDVDNTDLLTVIRQKETLVLGVSQIEQTSIPNVWATVCAAGKNDLDRLPEGTSFTRGISLVTQTKLQGAGVIGTDTYQPDLITWNGGQYLVKHVDIYMHVGSGFWQVLAESVTSQEPN